MPYGEYAECPCCGCGEIAKGKKEIEEKFGYRNMPGNKKIPQSYCRKCRIAGCKAGEKCRAVSKA